MFDNKFRSKIMQPLGLPVAKVMSRIGLTANQLSLISFLVALVSAYFFSKEKLLIGICFWWGSRILDGLDGVLARYNNSSSAFGGFLDISLDMLSYSAIIIAFSIAFPSLNFLWSLVLFGYVGCITTALALAQMSQDSIDPQDNRRLKLAMGLAEATETGIAYTLFAFFPAYLAVLVKIWIIILLITIIARIFYAYKIQKRD